MRTALHFLLHLHPPHPASAPVRPACGPLSPHSSCPRPQAQQWPRVFHRQVEGHSEGQGAFTRRKVAQGASHICHTDIPCRTTHHCHGTHAPACTHTAATHAHCTRFTRATCTAHHPQDKVTDHRRQGQEHHSHKGNRSAGRLAGRHARMGDGGLGWLEAGSLREAAP